MLSATVLVARFPLQQNLALVRVLVAIVRSISAAFLSLFLHTADPPRVTAHPIGLKGAVPGQPVTFTVHATGTEPLSYQWRWTLVGSGDKSRKEEWLLCDVKRSDGHTLTISSVRKSNEGSYHCVISNCAGSQESELATLSVGKNFYNSLQVQRMTRQHFCFLCL